MAARTAKVTPGLVVPMTWLRDTKGTHVYVAVADDAPITQLYIRKTGSFDGSAPVDITVTVTTD